MLVSFSVVAGPSFNDLDFDDDFLDTLPPGPQPDARREEQLRRAAWRRSSPGRSRRAWRSSASRGYSINRPDLVYRDVAGVEYRNQWKADAILLSVGAVYSLF